MGEGERRRETQRRRWEEGGKEKEGGREEGGKREGEKECERSAIVAVWKGLTMAHEDSVLFAE